jgi:SAM-dependent methyltransferase
MNHNEAIQYWKDMAADNPDEKTAKVNPQNDFTSLDANFIMKYADKNSEILDLASGTGMTINKYYEKVGHIDAVEIYPEFTKFIVKSTSINVFNESIADFVPNKKYNLILMFGIVQYFNEEEIQDIYIKYIDSLKPGGKLIIKNQFGVNKDVSVSGISKELNRPYYSEYRHIDKEVDILKSTGFSWVEVVDIYPTEANRWDNTHFYALVCGGVSR